VNIYEFKAGRQAVPQTIHADIVVFENVGELVFVAFYIDVKSQRTPSEYEKQLIEARASVPFGGLVGIPAIDPDGTFTTVERQLVHSESVFPGSSVKRIISAAPCGCSDTTIALYPPACTSCGGAISATEAK
jgi:hypothetical protein